MCHVQETRDSTEASAAQEEIPLPTQPPPWEIREDGSVMLIADLALGRSGGPQGSGVSTKVHSKGIAPPLPHAGVEWQAASSLLGSLCVECSLSFFRPQELGDV